MDSGIYQITFSSGKFYIGKSENMPVRWKTHQSSFLKHTHTRKMQAEYDLCGPPGYAVLLSVHPDHIDLYETALICQLWGPQILNTTKPGYMSPQDIETYLQIYYDVCLGGESVMLHSTLQHVTTLREQYHKANNYQQKLAQLQLSGVQLPHETQQKLQRLSAAEQELHKLKQRNWWQRLWDYSV